MQAQRIESASVQDRQPEPAARPQESQQVRMSRSELELYVREGCPTGLLLKSVAQLKGLSKEAISHASGIPAALVQSIFSDVGVSVMNRPAIRRMGAVLGIDLGAMRFAAGQVHVFNLAMLPGRAGSKESWRALRAVGLLARGAFVAELRVGSGLRALRWRGKLHVVQNENFRGLFIGAGRRRFDIEAIPSGTWVCKGRADSVVPIENDELSRGLLARDLTEGEFDELFQGAGAYTWDDIRAASRMNGVHKADLMNYIQTRAVQLEEAAAEQAKKAAYEERPVLRLVQFDRRFAAAEQ